MAELPIRPLLAHDPEPTPPGRWRILLLPVLMALIGILVATAATITGQDQRREMETLQKEKGWFYWENELAQARLRRDRPDKIARLEELAKEYREKPFSPFVEPGKHFSGWDGNRYEEIVVDGYVYHTPHDTEDVISARDIQRPGWPEKRTKNVVWYPLYPILAWSVMKLTGVSAASALTIVSESCIVFASVVMFLY